jgi:hypothetical protein
VIWYLDADRRARRSSTPSEETGIKVEMFRSGGSAILRRFQQKWTPAASPSTC